MSVSFAGRLPNAVIPIGDSVSQTFDSNYTYGDGALIGLAGVDSQQALTLTIQVSNDASTWFTLQDGAPLANLPVPAINNAATYIEMLAFQYFRIKSSANASGAVITIAVSRHWTTGN